MRRRSREDRIVTCLLKSAGALEKMFLIALTDSMDHVRVTKLAYLLLTHAKRPAGCGRVLIGPGSARTQQLPAIGTMSESVRPVVFFEVHQGSRRTRDCDGVAE